MCVCVCVCVCAVSAVNQMPPKKARACCRSAFGMYRDILHSPQISVHAKMDLEARLGLPLLLGDAVTSAGVNLPPLISSFELVDCFPSNRLPDIRTDQLATELDLILSPDGDGILYHDRLNQACNAVLRWLAAANRAVADLPGQTGINNGLLLRPELVQTIWQAVDQVQLAVRRLQYAVIEFAGVPSGCAAYGCADLHCRMYTRLERDADGESRKFLTCYQVVDSHSGLG